MSKKNILSEIERMKELNKILNEQNYDDAYGPSNLGSHGYHSGLGINPNADYSSDIGATKRKEKPEIDGRKLGKGGWKARDLDINNRKDRLMIINRLLKGHQTKKATPETLDKLYHMFSGDIINGIRNLHLNLKDDFDVELVYFLLKAGRFRNTHWLSKSKTFMNNLELSDYATTVYNPKTNEFEDKKTFLKFKENETLTLDDFVDFMKKNHGKMYDEYKNTVD